MTPVHALVIVGAGFVAGGMNAVVGAGSLVSFPALLAVGLPPVTANVSNTLGLVPGSVSGAFGYRSMLVGLGPTVRRLVVPAVAGGLTGAALLLVLPSKAFDAVVPLLLLLAALLVAFQPRITARLTAAAARREAAGTTVPGVHGGLGVMAWTFAVAVYGGYFGAALGVLLLAVFGALLGGIQAANGVKNVLAVAINLTAALVFAVFADVDWAAAGLLAVASLAGGYAGSHGGRRLPDRGLRIAIVVLAIGVAIQQIVT